VKLKKDSDIPSALWNFVKGASVQVRFWFFRAAEKFY